MRDERDRVATELSALVGGQARIDPDGQMRFVLEGGAVLVDGRRAAALAIVTGVSQTVTDMNGTSDPGDDTTRTIVAPTDRLDFLNATGNFAGGDLDVHVLDHDPRSIGLGQALGPKFDLGRAHGFLIFLCSTVSVRPSSPTTSTWSPEVRNVTVFP